MRSSWLIVMMGCAGCTGLNPAFLASSAGDSEGATGHGESSSATTSGGETTLPGTTGVQPTTGGNQTTASTGAVSVGETTGPIDTTGAVSDGTTTTGDTTGVPPDSTTDPVDSTGVPNPAVCGNAKVEDGEVCDQGMNPPLEPGACLPTCDGTIPTKTIFATGSVAGDFTFNGTLAIADDKCKALAGEQGLDGTFKAMISDGVTRVAATSAFDPSEAKDWVLHPYTAYLNPSLQLVSVTGPIPLLGVVPNADPNLPNLQLPLKNPINNGEVTVWTGLTSEWLSATNNCGKWKLLNGLGKAGNSSDKTNFLTGAGDILCQKPSGLICVQQ